MAVLEKIRSKAALLVIVIGVALFAFIIGDFLNSGSTFFQMSKNKVVVIDGTTVPYEEFLTRVNEMTEVYKMQTGQNNLTAEASAQINQMVYDALVRETLMAQETEAVGIQVTKAEMQELVSGNHISPLLQQMPMFRNQQTGEFDKAALANFLQAILSTEEGAEGGERAEQLASARSFWKFWEKSIKQQRLEEKFNSLLAAAFVPSKLNVQISLADNGTTADIVYAAQAYSTISDSTVAVSDREVKEQYEKEKERFKREAQRAAKYIQVNIVPSEQDYADAKNRFESMTQEFSTTNDLSSFMLENSDASYVDANVAISAMDPQMKAFAESATVGQTSSPFYEDEVMGMFRLVSKVSAPDSVKVRHIMVPIQDELRATQLTDSLLNVLRNGGNFVALAQQFSVDQNSAANGGELGWFTEESALRGISQEFKNQCFSAIGNGYFTVRTLYGMHIVQVTERTANVSKANVASFVVEVSASSKTFNEYYNELNQFIAKNNSLEKIEQAATDAKYMLLPVSGLNQGQTNFADISDARQIVRWVFNNKKGAISDIFELDNKFVVAVVTDVVDKGYLPMKDVEMYLKSQIIREKKGQMILEKLKTSGANSLQSYAAAMSASVDTARNVSFNSTRIPGIGSAPLLNAMIPVVPENTLQGPIAGKNAVIVFSVINKQTNTTTNPEQEKERLVSNLRYKVLYQYFDVLREKANIEDNRVKFF